MLWPLVDASGAQTTANTGTSSGYVSVQASATPHTVGSWVELVASTDRDYSEMTVILADSVATSATNTSTLINVGVGGSGSEVVLVAGIGVGHAGQGRAIRIPVRIAAGSRLSAQIQSAVVSKTCEVGLVLSGAGGWNPPDAGSRVTTYGANTGTSAGVDLTLPAAINTKGAWAQITGSTTAPIRWLVPLVVGNSTDTAWVANHRSMIDIGVGGSGSETVIIPNIPVAVFNNEALLHWPVTIPVRIPAGTRLAARYQEALLGEGPGVILLGVD